MSTERIAKELEVYERNKERLIAEAEGKWVVIGGEEVKGIWDTYEDALKAGYAEFGLSPFLVKKIEGTQRIQFISRDIELCPS